ncbi:MAG: hypothetical protein ACOCXW_02280 [Bacteroidota bacterium]
MDANPDGVINYDEYLKTVSGTNLFIEIDVGKDDYVLEVELAEVIFRFWDLDDSGFTDKSEYVAYEDFYLKTD